MSAQDIDDLIKHITIGFINDGDIFLTQDDRDLIVDALEFYKEMQVI